MKTAISIPDDVFQAIEERANALGMNRSEFMTTAARAYLDSLDRDSLTSRIDTVLDHADARDASIVARGLDSLRAEDW